MSTPQTAVPSQLPPAPSGTRSSRLLSALLAAIGVFGSDPHSAYHYNRYVLAGVIAVALMFNHFLACTTGVVIPFAMRRMGFDPAQSATVWATTVTDCCGFFCTLGIAHLCMQWLLK